MKISSPHILANQSLNIIKGLNNNIIQLQMMEESKKWKDEKDKEETQGTDEDDFLQVESLIKRRSKKRKREEEASLDDSHLKNDEVETMGELELKNVELVKEMVP